MSKVVDPSESVYNTNGSSDYIEVKGNLASGSFTTQGSYYIQGTLNPPNTDNEPYNFYLVYGDIDEFSDFSDYTTRLYFNGSTSGATARWGIRPVSGSGTSSPPYSTEEADGTWTLDAQFLNIATIAFRGLTFISTTAPSSIDYIKLHINGVTYTADFTASNNYGAYTQLPFSWNQHFGSYTSPTTRSSYTASQVTPANYRYFSSDANQSASNEQMQVNTSTGGRTISATSSNVSTSGDWASVDMYATPMTDSDNHLVRYVWVRGQPGDIPASNDLRDIPGYAVTATATANPVGFSDNTAYTHTTPGGGINNIYAPSRSILAQAEVRNAHTGNWVLGNIVYVPHSADLPDAPQPEVRDPSLSQVSVDGEFDYVGFGESSVLAGASSVTITAPDSNQMVIQRTGTGLTTSNEAQFYMDGSPKQFTGNWTVVSTTLDGAPADGTWTIEFNYDGLWSGTALNGTGTAPPFRLNVGGKQARFEFSAVTPAANNPQLVNWHIMGATWDDDWDYSTTSQVDENIEPEEDPGHSRYYTPSPTVNEAVVSTQLSGLNGTGTVDVDGIATLGNGITSASGLFYYKSGDHSTETDLSTVSGYAIEPSDSLGDGPDAATFTETIPNYSDGVTFQAVVQSDQGTFLGNVVFAPQYGGVDETAPQLTDAGNSQTQGTAPNTSPSFYAVDDDAAFITDYVASSNVAQTGGREFTDVEFWYAPDTGAIPVDVRTLPGSDLAGTDSSPLLTGTVNEWSIDNANPTAVGDYWVQSIGFYDEDVTSLPVSSLYIQEYSIKSQESNPTGVTFSPDGLNCYIIGNSGNGVHQYKLTTPFDLSTMSHYAFKYINILTYESLQIKPDGTKLYVMNLTNDRIYQYTFGTPYDITTLSLAGPPTLSLGAQESFPTGFFIRSDGLRLYVVGTSGDDINEYHLSSAWEINTASYVRRNALSANDSSNGVAFSSDGTLAYIVNTTEDAVRVYQLATAWNVSDMELVSVMDASRATQGDSASFPEDIYLHPNGEEFFIIDSSNDMIERFRIVTRTPNTALGQPRLYTILEDDVSVAEDDSVTTLPATEVGANSATMNGYYSTGTIHGDELEEFRFLYSENVVAGETDIRTRGTEGVDYQTTPWQVNNVVPQVFVDGANDYIECNFSSVTRTVEVVSPDGNTMQWTYASTGISTTRRRLYLNGTGSLSNIQVNGNLDGVAADGTWVISHENEGTTYDGQDPDERIEVRVGGKGIDFGSTWTQEETKRQSWNWHETTGVWVEPSTQDPTLATVDPPDEGPEEDPAFGRTFIGPGSQLIEWTRGGLTEDTLYSFQLQGRRTSDQAWENLGQVLAFQTLPDEDVQTPSSDAPQLVGVGDNDDDPFADETFQSALGQSNTDYHAVTPAIAQSNTGTDLSRVSEVEFWYAPLSDSATPPDDIRLLPGGTLAGTDGAFENLTDPSDPSVRDWILEDADPILVGDYWVQAIGNVQGVGVLSAIEFTPGNGYGLTFDGTNLWVSDTTTNLLYEVDPSNGNIISSVPAPSNFGYGLTFDGTNLWVGDTTTDLLYEVDPSNGNVLSSVPAPGTFGVGLTFDGTNLWVSDTTTDLLYEVDPSNGNIISSVPAPANSGYGLTFDGTNLWVSDTTTDLLYEVDPSDGNVLSSVPAPANNGYGLAFDGTNLWVSDVNTDLLYEVTRTKVLHAPAGNGYDLTFDGTNLWVSDIGTDLLYEINPSTGTVISSVSAPAGLGYGLTFDGTNLWVSDTTTDLLYEVDPSNGNIISSISAPGTYGIGLAFDGTNLWVNDGVTDLLYEVDPSNGNIISSVPAPSNIGFGLTFDGTNLWVSDPDDDLLYEVDPSNGTVLNIVPAPANSGYGLAFDGTNLWVSNLGTNLLYEYPINPAPQSQFPRKSASRQYTIHLLPEITVEQDDQVVTLPATVGADNATLNGSYSEGTVYGDELEEVYFAWVAGNYVGGADATVFVDGDSDYVGFSEGVISAGASSVTITAPDGNQMVIQRTGTGGSTNNETQFYMDGSPKQFTGNWTVASTTLDGAAVDGTWTIEFNYDGVWSGTGLHGTGSPPFRLNVGGKQARFEFHSVTPAANNPQLVNWHIMGATWDDNWNYSVISQADVNTEPEEDPDNAKYFATGGDLRTVTGRTITPSQTPPSPGGQFDQLITGLTAQTQYSFQAFGERITDQNWETTGQILTFITAPLGEYELSGSEAVNMLDAPINNPSVPLADALSLIDSIVNTPNPILSESLTIFDDHTFAFNKVLAETLTITDAVVTLLEIVLNLSDSISVSDAIGPFEVYKNLFQSMGIADSLAIAFQGDLFLNEGFTLSDSLVNHTSKYLADAVTIDDTFAVEFEKFLTETLQITDTKTLAVEKVLTEDVLTIADAITEFVVTKALAESLNVVDSVNFDVDLYLNEDTINVEDSLVNYVQLLKSEGINISDEIDSLLQQIRAFVRTRRSYFKTQYSEGAPDREYGRGFGTHES